MEQLSRQIALDSIEVQREMLKEIGLLRSELAMNTNSIKSLHACMNNGVMGKLCKKVDKVYFAVVVLLVPLLVVLVKVFWK